jgi:hypothetical protein
MPKPKIELVSVCRQTVNGRRFYPWHSIEHKVEVKFSKTRKTCILPNGTVLIKAKGLGYWTDVENYDVWLIRREK